MNTVIGDALQLGARGWPVFPCKTNKTPACPRGFYDAATDASAIETLWHLYPGDLIGVPTGVAFDVLDVDAKHDAAHTWWGKHRHDMPDTPVHRTRSGGLHLLFSCNAIVTCSAGKLASGVDTRGGGGYIIWWPAAGYEVLRDVPLAPWPEWLVQCFAPKPQPPKQINGHIVFRGDRWLRGLARTVAAAVDGQRNSTLFWAACRARERVDDGKADEDFITDVLLEAARVAGLPALEAQRTIYSGMRGKA